MRKTLNSLEEINESFSEREDLHNRLDEQFTKSLKDSDLKTLDAEKKNIATHFNNIRRKVSEHIEIVRTKQADLAHKLQELEKKQTEKEKLQVNLIDYQLKYKLKKMSVSSDTYENEKANLKEKYEILSEDIQNDTEEILDI